MAHFLHKGDLPSHVKCEGDIAVDTETKGLNIALRDRLCLLQLSDGHGDVHLVQFAPGVYDAPNLKRLLADESRVKIFHYARFDLAAIRRYLGVEIRSVFCTKLASRLVRTYAEKHGLKELCKELLSIDMSKQQQSSDWGLAALTPEQVEYAASDVLYLHRLREKLQVMLRAENREGLAQRCFDFLPTRAELDLSGWGIEPDVFSH